MTDKTRIEIRLPRLGWSMEEGTFVGWLKQPGEHVQAGQPLFTLENDKATQDVEAIDSGTLQFLDTPPQTGQIYAVGALLGYLLSDTPIPSGSSSVSPSRDVQPAPATATLPQEQMLTSEGVPTVEPLQSERVRISPRARRLADQHHVDTSKIIATGTSGRIAEKDVRAAIERQGGLNSASDSLDQIVSPFRRTIAQRMLDSQQQTAPVTLVCTIDAAGLVATRSRFKSQATTQAVPSYTDIVIQSCARALAAHPMLAVRWVADRCVLAESMDIGFAVDTAYGLVVPVVRQIDRLSLVEIATRSRELITAAHDRRLQSHDLEGGIFTVTNLGSYGIDAFTPIINYPQCAILGLGAIRREPVVLDDGTVGAGWRMTLSLTFDHRRIDGAPAASFMQTLRALLEE